MEWDLPDESEFKDYYKGITDYYIDTWSKADDMVFSKITDGFKLIGDDIVKQFKSFGDGIKGTAKDAVVGSVSAAFRGEMDSVEDIWGDSWDKMVSSVDGMFDTLFDSLIVRIKDIGTNIGYDMFAKPGADWVMKTTGLGPLTDYAGDAIPDILTGLLHGGIAKTANTAMLGNAINSISTTLGNMFFGGTELQVGAGMSGVGEGIGGGAASGAGMGALGTGLLAGGGMLAGLEGVSALMGMPGPTEAMFGAVSSIFGNGDGHSQQSAQQYIAADFESLARQVELYNQRLETLGQGLDELLPKNGEFLTQISDQAMEMERLAERAGMSQEQIDAMVDGLDPWGAAMVESAQVSANLNDQIERAVQEMASMGDAMGGGVEAGDALYDKLMYLVDGMSAAGVETDGLSGLIDDMIDGFISGEVSADAMSQHLQKEFAAALQAAAAQGEVGADKMRELAESIQSIPQFWRSEVHTYHYDHYEDVGRKHGGGMVLHGGGGVWPRLHAGALVSDLAHDEVPIIARRGEFVVRAESVNAATLPLLQALNRGGNTAAPAGPALSINAPLVEVHGNIVGSDESFEDLVRQIETKLREVASARYG